ncbi:MAG TPA: YbaB/EbfC family nucleoid-associated protein [Glycomyces sp.]|nr:YbaB/EbfC family nucleoid-associated protein [Glycomyces sp.]
MTANDLPPPPDAAASGPDRPPPADAELKEYMRDFEADMAGLERRAERLRPLIDATCVRASSEDGAVTVTVTVTGALVGVALGESFRLLGERELAALIIDTYDRAVAEAARRRDG